MDIPANLQSVVASPYFRVTFSHEEVLVQTQEHKLVRRWYRIEVVGATAGQSVLTALGCDKVATVQSVGPTGGALSPLVVGGGLKHHENIQGAHVTSKHIERSRDFLAKRIATDDLTMASSFYDIGSAELCISRILADHESEIEGWLGATGPYALTLQKEFAGEVIGVVLKGDTSELLPGRVLSVVLKRSPSDSDLPFVVHTCWLEP